MKQQLLYRELAKYYDFIYQWKDYKTEAEKVKAVIQKYKKSPGNKLLEVACGTGHHLQYLKKDYDCMGVDLNREILKEAKKKHPDLPFKQADMTTMNLGQQFDIITCLFSSIGYVKTYPKLGKTFKVMAKHLQPGGVVIIEGWLEPKVYKDGNPGMNTYDGPDLKIARLNCGIRKGSRSIMDMHYLVAEKNKPVKHFVDRHDMGLFEKEKFVKLMEAAGLEVHVIDGGLMQMRNLYVGVKP